MPLSKREQKILESIKIASENNPSRPEFPADDPKFPATPTYRIRVPGFSNVWLKDESFNPTGTHKDRMAWEIIVSYRAFLLAKKNGQIKGNLPHMSIISSGSAATAIQIQLTKYQLPNLKVLMDKDVVQETVKRLKTLGCEVFTRKLRQKSLSWQEILKATKNLKGFDITSNEAIDPTTRFYDWLSYEVINSSPEYCFIPFGTGNLFENILNITKREITDKQHDPRFDGNIKTLRNCHFIGATTDNRKSLADKLYSPHLPFTHYDEQWMRFYKYAGFCGSKSNVMVVKEKYLKKALTLAHSQGINCEPSGIAGLALLLQMKSKVPKNAKVLIVNTGNSTKLFNK